MQENKDFDAERIQTILEQVRNVKKNVGDYVGADITEEGDCVVELSNGKIKLYEAELLQGKELLPFRIKEIADRFR
ncbi:hypothetical protein ACI6Q2_07830 [Chitinophagaceae bacterium LWZ2-11]